MPAGYIYLLKNSKPTDEVAVIDEFSLETRISECKQTLYRLKRLRGDIKGKGHYYDENFLKKLGVKFTKKKLVVKKG